MNNISAYYQLIRVSGGQHSTIKRQRLGKYYSQHDFADTSWMRVAAVISSITRKIAAKNFISINTQNVVITD